MKLNTTILAVITGIALTTGGCYSRKASGTKATLSQNTPVPASGARQADTAVRSPSPKIAPSVNSNIRPNPVPSPQPPVPPM
ncbi:hypothetical protein [Mucilaginibacter sp.]